MLTKLLLLGQCQRNNDENAQVLSFIYILYFLGQSSAKDLQPVQKPKAKLRDSFILTQDENVATVLQSGTEEIPKGGLSLKSIIQKHENKNGN